MSIFDPILAQWNRLTGGGREFSVTVPVMDGPMKPNDALEAARRIASLPGAANLTARGDGLVFSRGRVLCALTADGTVTEQETFEAEITALAATPEGGLAVGLAGVGVELRAHDSRKRIEKAGGRRLACVTALAFTPKGVAIANGSDRVAPADWVHDLMNHGGSGFVAFLPSTGESRVLAEGLRWPAGVCATGAEALAVTEAWGHRILRVSTEGADVTGTLLDHLPAYPARIVPRAGGGYLLANISVRSQLIEFVLRERRFLRRMRAEVAPEHWIAPALSSGHSFKEPLQSGGVIRLGIHKPWAPTRSYGLVIALAENFRPVWSAHSRADGNRHGVTSVAETSVGVAALAQGNGDLILLNREGTPAKEEAMA